MPRGTWEKLCLNQPPPAIVHTKFFTGTPPPPIPPPTIGCFPAPPPPPPKEKGRHRKHRPPHLENNCTPVLDTSVCDNFNLILILVV